MPSKARRKSLAMPYLVCPAWRASRSYARLVCRKPAQVRRPRRNLLRSGRARSTATTRASNSEKSPESTGIFKYATLRRSR